MALRFHARPVGVAILLVVGAFAWTAGSHKAHSVADEF
jgi:hypothetical protein